MTVVACTDFPEPQDLKEILELLDKLGESVQAKKNVGQKLLKDVRKYCKETDKFFKDSRSHSGFLWNVFSNAYGIRDSILQNSRTYPKYKDLTDSSHTGHKDCALKISEALKKCLPKAYAALYYLYFMGNKSLDKTIKGGKWKNQRCNGTGRFGTDLHNWLTDEKNLSRTLTPGLIKRGFKSGELHGSNDGSTVVGPLKKAVSITLGQYDGSLQKALCYMLFVCPWHDALAGHALLFLDKFCEKVTGGKSLEESFKKICSKVSFDTLKDFCQDLKGNLNPFVNAHGTSGLRAVSKESTSNLFDEIWDESKFEAYCDWLKMNLKALKKSLKEMSGESSAWNPSALSNASTAGPLKYGFIFGNRDWERGIKNRLEGPLGKLLSSLDSLDDCVNDISSGNPGATAGGVFTGLLGTGGLGAGAAYATNAFGFQNFITGLISGFLK